MTTKLLVRQGGGAATEVDFANDFNPRKGAPFFQENTPLLRMGQRWADGEAAQGEFLVVDPNATESTAGFRIRPWAEVRLTEDASGDELTLAWMRFTSRDVQRRGLYVPGDEVEHTPQLMDCNVDLRGIPFRNGWERPAETDIERLEALFERKLSGSSSTAPNIFRITTDITFDSFANGHLAEHNTPVDMEAWTYPPGTEVSEVLAHIADEAGKQWGVVLHHDGGSTHKCLLYVDDDDLDRWTTAVRISDDSTEWDPDDPTAPTFEPHWLQGAGREADFNEVITGLINIYGGTTEDPKTVYVETGEAPEDQETWVGVRNDDETRTEGGATRHANHYLTNHRNPRQSNKVSILVKAAQAHLVTAGQAIQIKSVVTNTGADKETFKWRRVAECIVEPAADGLYWLHLSLERPRKGFGGGGSGGGRGQPAATSPKPPPACEVPAGDVEVCSYDADDGDLGPVWPGGYLPTGASPPQAFDVALPGFAPYMLVGAGQTTDLIAACSLVPGNSYHVSIHAGTNSQYATYRLKFNQNAGPSNQTIAEVYPNSPTPIEFDIGGNFTVDAGASEFVLVLSSTFGGWHYNEVLITEAAPEPDNDEFCIDPSLPADSPYYLPSDTVQALIDQAVAEGIADAIPWFNVKRYGALGDGETDDTAAINSAIDDVNLHGAGILYFPAGDYIVTGALTTITAAVTIRGDGSMSFDAAEWGTRIFIDDSTVDLFTLTGKIAKVEHIGFHCDSGGTPTAGSAVHTDGAYLEQKVDFEDVHSRGFWYGFDIEVGAQWSMVNCQITAPKKYGVYIRNTVNNDAGDWSIVNSNFNAHAYNADAAIRVESAGGGKIANTKINMGFPAGSKFVNGIDFSIAGQTVILEVTNCSIENVTGHAIAGAVPTGSAFFRHINIHGNQVGLYSNNTGKAVSLVAADSGDISEVVIADNIFHTTGTARSAIQLTKCDNVVLVANVLSGFDSLYTNTSSTNVTEIGGVSDHGALTGLTDDDHTQYLKETDVAAKGDIYAASANDTVGVLTVGTNGQILTAASGETLGVKWSDPATAGNAVGPILIQDTPAGSPLVFADLLQNDDGDDLLYADV